MTIGIVVIATNSYFILGLRFIKRFMHFYKGNQNIKFYFFSDLDPKEYLSDQVDIKYINSFHKEWSEGTNSKFKNIISLNEEELDYIFYFDADTNVCSDFYEDWFLGDLVAGEHFGNRTWMIVDKPFDRNPQSKAYIPKDTNLPQTYYYGAFFGGKKEKVISLCKLMLEWQIEDKKIPHEPIFNDESYLNCYFHNNLPSYTVPTENFPFMVSDKGGIGDTRVMSLDTSILKSEFLKYKNVLNINIYDSKIVTYEN
jgi:hypothetical protein